MEVRLASIRQTEGYLGRTWLNASGDEDDLTCATILVAGEVAQRIAAGGYGSNWVAFNWFDDWPGGDAERARSFTDSRPDPLAARRLVDLKAECLLRNRWGAVEAVAKKLESSTLILPAEIDRLCREAGALKVGERRRRPYDPDKHFVNLPNGKKVTMRKWADAVAASGFNKKRAERMLEDHAASQRG